MITFSHEGSGEACMRTFSHEGSGGYYLLRYLTLRLGGVPQGLQDFLVSLHHPHQQVVAADRVAGQGKSAGNVPAQVRSH